MEKCLERATLDYNEGAISIRIDCPGVNEGNSDVIRGSLTLYFLNKLLGLLAEKGFMERNDAGDALFLFEDYLQNKGNVMSFDDISDCFDLEDERGYF